MFTKSYDNTVLHVAGVAPSIEASASEFILWAEPICDLISFIYNKDYDEVTQDLFEAVKEDQDYEDED